MAYKKNNIINYFKIEKKTIEKNKVINYSTKKEKIKVANKNISKIRFFY